MNDRDTRGTEKQEEGDDRVNEDGRKRKKRKRKAKWTMTAEETR